MELHPTARSWRVALVTAVGSGLLAAVAIAAITGGAAAPVLWWIVAIASLATFVPAVGTLSAAVDTDEHGVTVRRFGFARSYEWARIVTVDVVDRRASVPDGTEYHWVVPSIRRHVVSVPCLELDDGRRRQLPALARPSSQHDDALAQADAIKAGGARLPAPG